VFATRDELLEWVRKVSFRLGFIVVILRSDKATGSQGRKTYVLLGCERSGKYRKYKTYLEVSIIGTRKCECPFRLCGKPIKGEEGWVLKVICGSHNYELANTLVGHPYAGRLQPDEHALVVDMTKSRVKPKNILLTLKEKNEDNVATLKCGCVLRYTHGLPCACELARYAFGVILLNEVHVMWTRLSFSNLSSS